ncbi:MAG: putative Ig domain-containing protein, partial [Synergistaceae bacterium]|nr:putative Ig domain-containing protein [Synergistaceae bacterium]
MAIDAAHFPDANFRSFVSGCDSNNDGVLSDKEIARVTWINLNEYGVSSLQGVEYFTALKELYCSYNQLTTLDLTKNTKLTYLNCSNNQLTTLDLTKNTKLKYLGCEGNHLMALDVNKNAPLSGWVDCSPQILSPLNITDSGNASYPFQLDLRDYLSSKQIAKVSTDVQGYFVLAGSNGWLPWDSNSIPTKYSTRIARFASKPATVRYTYIASPATASRNAITMDVVITTPVADVAVNAANFPDDTFREYVSNNFDRNGNGVLSHDEIVSASWINVEDSRISSLQGIEYLVNVQSLNCNNNRLTELDVSKNYALQWLNCGNNRLTELKVGQYTALEKLDCDNNRLTSFDVSYSTRLTSLSCQESSRLVALDLSKVTALKNLTCYNTGLISLDVSGCTELTELNCQYSQLKELDLRKKTKLRKVHCNNNQLTKLRLSKNTELEELECQGNYLTTLNVRDCPELTKLNCGWNQLTELDVSQNPELSYLNCQENHLAVLDVSHNEYLTGLDCWSQTISPLFVISNGNGYYPYKFKLVNYMTSEQVANVSGLEVYDYNWNWIATMIQDGVVYCTSFPSIVRYNYAVGYNSTNMNVTLSDATYIAPPEIPGTFANGKLSAKYSSFVTISGDTAPYTCEMTSGTLPKGLKLKFSKTKITLYGTPKESGEFTFMIQITDANGATTTQTFALKITRPDITGTLSNGTVNGEYSGRLTVSGGTNPYTWEISSGTLPDG